MYTGLIETVRELRTMALIYNLREEFSELESLENILTAEINMYVKTRNPPRNENRAKKRPDPKIRPE